MMEFLVLELVLKLSDIEEDELAALAVFPAGSTKDFDRSRFCFCRNLGNFGPWCVDDGDVGDEDCLEGLLLDIAGE